MIYLDYNATTPTDPLVVEAMLPWFYEHPGNPSSRAHRFGWEAQEAIDQAQYQIAGLIGADPREIIFTSGATESDNLGLLGVFKKYRHKGQHFITLGTEHQAVRDACSEIERRGGQVTVLPVGQDGLVNPEIIDRAIRDDTVLVSVMWANNETGVIQPMAEIGEVCKRRGVLFLSDGAQAVGKIPVNVKDAGVHLMALSAHKMYGPKGVGALYVSSRSPRVGIAPQMFGGGQQGGIRPGTLNVPGIVGFGKAAEIALDSMHQEMERLSGFRDVLEQALTVSLPAVFVNGSRSNRLPHVSNLSFTGLEGDAILMACARELALSTGSACSSATPDPSHVLTAMGLGRHRSKAALRFSAGRFTTETEISRSIELITTTVKSLRATSPLWDLYQDGVELP